MARSIRSPDGKPKTLAAIHPNAGITAEYRRRLEREIKAMHDSILYWLSAAYRSHPPEMAQDAAPPSDWLARYMRSLGKRWEDRFDKLARDLAEHFGRQAAQRSDASLKAALKRGGMSVSFKVTPAMRDVLAANIQENVALIKSIQSRHFQQIEGMVMRSAQTGRDLASLQKDLIEAYGVSKKRAAFIARDQNNKATATITRVRQQEIGATQAIWLHSGAGKHPRPTHVAKSGKPYDIRTGWFDRAEGKNGEWLWPGTAINCRCVSKVIIPGM
jgi:uncharacterized protein with gpF-like domain